MRTANCSCGACAVDVEGEPTFSGLCNCNDCRRRTGAPFGWSAYFRDDQILKTDGPFSTRTVTTADASPEPYVRSFCGLCGSTLFWRSAAGTAGVTGFAAGCFNDPSLPAPPVAVHHSQRMPWVVFPEGCQLMP